MRQAAMEDVHLPYDLAKDAVIGKVRMSRHGACGKRQRPVKQDALGI